jgi:succinate dehydrogenase / fumarate reductase, cytochrome b subunit
MAAPSPRPLSPHLSVWRWHATMASSILHRATGVANYTGAVLIAFWLVMAASGPDAHAVWENAMAGPLGIVIRIILIGFTFSVSYHLLNGLRHLAWDAGLGFDPKGSNLRSVLIIVLAAAFTAGVWIGAWLA